MQKKILSVAAISGFICVALGAFGAHALKTRLSAEQIQVFETAVRYQFYHTFVLLFLSLIPEKTVTTSIKTSVWLFLSGIILFSGSLYLLVMSYLFAAEPLKWLGAITPVGGICFILGWLNLFRFSLQLKSI